MKPDKIRYYTKCKRGYERSCVSKEKAERHNNPIELVELFSPETIAVEYKVDLAEISIMLEKMKAKFKANWDRLYYTLEQAEIALKCPK